VGAEGLGEGWWLGGGGGHVDCCSEMGRAREMLRYGCTSDLDDGE